MSLYDDNNECKDLLERLARAYVYVKQIFVVFKFLRGWPPSKIKPFDTLVSTANFLKFKSVNRRAKTVFKLNHAM